MMILIISALLIALLCYLFLLGHFPKHLPPGPNIFHILLSISQLVNKPHILFTNLSKIYGPLISLRLGGRLIVVASSASLAKEIYKTQNKIFTGRYLPSVFYYVPGTSTASLVMSKECNDTWKFIRGLTQQSFFSVKAIESSATIRKSKVMEMVKFLSVEKMGQIVNMETMIFAGFINITSSVLVSRNVFETGGEGEKDVIMGSFVNEVIDKSSTFGLSDVFPVLKGVDFWSRRRARDIYRRMKAIWGDVINERRRKHVDPNSKLDFLDVLLEMGTTFSDDNIRVMITELLIGGADSTTVTSVWLMSELIKNPKIMHEVHKEIVENAVVEEYSLNESLLSKCQYFQACIKETMRLHAPGPLALPRRTLETCKVDNYIIPKDTVVLVNAWAIQLDPNNWEDPYSFKPERFLNSEVDFSGNHFEYIPFSSGQRMCPGKHLGVTGVELMVASLLHYFEWSLPNGVDPSKLDMNGRFGTTLKKEKPLFLIPKSRYKI